MKYVLFIIALCAFSVVGMRAQDEAPYRVIDTTMVFSEADFNVVTDRRGLNYIQHIHFSDDPSFSYMDPEWEKAKLMWWLPKFYLHPDERVATADCVSCELEDEVLFLDDPCIRGESVTEPLHEDAPNLPFYAFTTDGKTRLLSEMTALSQVQDWLYAVHTILVKVCPFRYDSQTDKLYLYKKVRIKIRLAERPMNKYVQEGYVRDQDGKAVPNALLTLSDTIQYRTDADGHFKITVESWDSNINRILWVTAENHTSCKSDVGTDFPISVTNLSHTINYQLYNALNFKAGQLSTIILPIAPDVTLGRYFRLDRVEDDNIVFEREFSPKAYYPYILIPDKDARIELAGMNLRRDTTVLVSTSDYAAAFHGALYSYSQAYSQSEGYYPLEAWNVHPGYVEAMHALLTRPYFAQWGLILHDPDNDADAIHDISSLEMVKGKWYDLSGRRIGDGQWKMENGQLPRGVYIREGKKVMVK